MKSNRIKLEICAVSPHSARAAFQGGADRIELCAALEMGGITPSFSAIEMSVKQSEMPVFVLVRPRAGDFCYSQTELQQMIRDIEICRELGVQGIVSGALHPDGSIQLSHLKALLKASEGMSFTFHRAFDRCNDPFAAAMQLADAGVQRILSSGQRSDAYLGAPLLAALVEKMNGQITFLPGGGINTDNVVELIRITGATEVHFSAKKTQKSPFSFNSALADSNDYIESDEKLIQKMVELLHSLEGK